MFIIIPFISLLGYSFYFAKITKTDHFRHILTSVAFITVILYIAGFFGCLLSTSKILFWIGILMFCIFIFKANKSNIKSDFINQLPVFIILLIILLELPGFNFVSKDDFSHWAVIAKEIFVTNSLPISNNTAVTYTQYPPATALFGYFMISNASSVWVEWMMIFSQGIITFSGLCFFITLIPQNLSFRDRLFVSSVISALYLSYPCVMLLLLQIDQILGICMFLIVGYYITAKSRLDAMLPMFIILIFFSILKLSSLPMLIICLTVILVYRWTKKEYIVPTLETIGLFILAFAISLILRKLWFNQVYHTSINNWTHNTDNIPLIFSGRFWYYYLINFIKYIFFSSVAIVSTFVTIINLYFLKKFNIENKRHYFAILLSLMVLYALYLFSLLYTYVVVFGWNGRLSNLHSMGRYLYSYLIFIFGVNIIMFVYSDLLKNLLKTEFYKKNYKKLTGLFIIAYFTFIVIISFKIYERKNPNFTFDVFRAEMVEKAEKVKSQLSINKKVFILYEGFRSKECLVFRYEMIPYHTVFEHCLIGDFPAKIILTNQQLQEILPNCSDLENTLIYIPKDNDQFRSRVDKIIHDKCRLSAHFL